MSWRDVLLARINNAADFGLVYGFERYGKSNDMAGLKNLYIKDEVLAGGFLRLAQAHAEHDGGLSGGQRTVELTLFSGWQDGEQSQLVFENNIELLIADSADNARLDGSWMFKNQNGVVGWQLQSHQPATFAGVLVHMAKLRTVVYQIN
jgi:hypothetical protein